MVMLFAPVLVPSRFCGQSEITRQLRVLIVHKELPFFICGPPQRKQPAFGFEGMPPGLRNGLAPPNPPVPTVVS